ncbi:hypothetical protein NSP_20140 [Nodularia spumigena CCY9414]|nr:hypothetical protein NSP_20140 [Nodularia spumigena CCY9414]
MKNFDCICCNSVADSQANCDFKSIRHYLFGSKKLVNPHEMSPYAQNNYRIILGC